MIFIPVHLFYQTNKNKTMYFNTYEVYIIYNYKSENNNYIAGSSTYKNLLKRYQPSSSSSYPSVVV